MKGLKANITKEISMNMQPGKEIKQNKFLSTKQYKK